LIYVANGTTTLSVIDGATDSVTATVTLPLPVRFVAVDSAANKIYAGGVQLNEPVYAIDGATNVVARFATTPLNVVSGLAVNPATNLLYVVGTTGFFAPSPAVIALNGTTGALWSSRGLDQTMNPYNVVGGAAIAVNSVTNQVYIGGNTAPGLLQVWDGATQALSSVFTVGTDPQVMVSDDATNTIYAAQGNGTVAVINGATKSQVGPDITVGNLSSAIAFNPHTKQLFVTDYLSGGLAIVDAGTAMVVGSVAPTGSHPAGVAVNPTTDKVYVANLSDGTVTIIDAAQHPTKPLLVQATPGAGQATISWSPPTSDGGVAISSYTATAMPGGIACTTALTSCTILGLTPGTTYSVTVTATNSAGNSEPSDSVSILPSAATTPSTTASTLSLAATGANLEAPSAVTLGLLGLGGVVLARRRRGVRA